MNNAINPKDEQAPYITSLMPCRSGKIKKVVARAQSGGVGGATDLKTGTVWVPVGSNAKERTIRYHEALHATHTAIKATPKDMLDQALEDARLHRHCSKSAESAFQRARRDELAVALTELRQAGRAPVLQAVHSLTILRAMAMVRAGTVKPAHGRVLARVVGKLGKGAMGDFEK